jgi:hypothetical protein
MVESTQLGMDSVNLNSVSIQVENIYNPLIGKVTLSKDTRVQGDVTAEMENIGGIGETDGTFTPRGNRLDRPERDEPHVVPPGPNARTRP